MGFDDILNFISDTADVILGQAQDCCTAVFDFTFGVDSFLGGALTVLHDFFLGAFHRVLDFLRSLWRDGWKGVIPNLWHAIRNLFERLHKFFQPLIDYLHHVRQFWDMAYRLHIVPILNFIQRLRQILVIFRFFHFKFAQRLDGYLVDLESRIVRGLLIQRRALNLVIGWVSLIADPLYFIRVNFFLRSFFAAVDDLWLGVTGRTLLQTFGEGNEARGGIARSLSRQAVLGDFEDATRTGTGPLSDLGQALLRDYQDLTLRTK